MGPENMGHWLFLLCLFVMGFFTKNLLQHMCRIKYFATNVLQNIQHNILSAARTLEDSYCVIMVKAR